MLIVGLTGGIGSGKSTVAGEFSRLGVPVFNADNYARAVVEPGSPALSEISQHFGRDILLADGKLDRRKLRSIVFADEQQRLWLEKLLHPLIARELGNALAECNAPYAILESPLLLETSQRDMVDRVLVVDVSEELQLQRTRDRDGSEDAVIQGIIAAQMPRQQRLQQADDVIDNAGTAAELNAKVAALHKRYQALALVNE